MKNIKYVILILIYLVLSLDIFASDYKVNVDGKVCRITNPIIYEDEGIYISLRDYANLINGQLLWDKNSRTATLSVAYGNVRFNTNSSSILNIRRLHSELQHDTFLSHNSLYVNIDDLNNIFLSQIKWGDGSINIHVIDTSTSYNFAELIPNYQLVDKIGFAPGTVVETEYIYSPEVIQEVLKQFIDNRFTVSSQQEWNTGMGYYILYSKDKRIEAINLYGNGEVQIDRIRYTLAEPLTLMPEMLSNDKK